MKRMWRPIVVMAVMVVVFALPIMASANNSWSKYHWDISTKDSSNDNPLELGDNLTTPEWKSSLGAASTDWNDSVLKNEIAEDGYNPACDPVLGGVEVCNAEYGENGWLGIAQVWVYRGKDGHIAQGLVKLNDTYFNTSPYNTPAWRDYVACQEVGHTLGLDHQDENFSNDNMGTCMDYTNNPDGTTPLGQLDNRHPDQHDYDVLFDKYRHLNEIDDGGDKPKNGKGGGRGKPAGVGANIDLNNPSAWGQAIKQDAQGKNSLFRRDLGNGQVLLTYVIWVK